MVKLGQSGTYLKADQVKTGDVITFMNEGEWQTSNKYRWKNEDGSDGEFKKSFVISVKLGDDTLLMRVNKTSRDSLVNIYGDDTASRVGKNAKIAKEHSRQINADVLYLEPMNGKTEGKSEAEVLWDE